MVSLWPATRILNIFRIFEFGTFLLFDIFYFVCIFLTVVKSQFLHKTVIVLVDDILRKTENEFIIINIF